MLGLGTGIVKGGGRASNLGIITDNLVLKHNYDTGRVHQVSTGAAFFNGTSDTISLGTITGTTGHKSMTAWIYHDGSRTLSGSSSNQGAILTFADVMFELTTATEITAWEDVNNGTGDGDIPTALNNWRHVAVTMEVSGSNTIHKIYADGVLIDTDTANSSVPTTDSRASVIGSYAGGRFFPGYICNVGFWSGKVLTQAEIKSIMWKKYADLTSDEKTSMVSWWNLDSVIDSTETVGVGSTTVYDNHHGGGDTLGANLVTSYEVVGTQATSKWIAFPDDGSALLTSDNNILTATIGGGANSANEGARYEVTGLSGYAAGKTYKVQADLWLGTYEPDPTGAFRIQLGASGKNITLSTTRTTFTVYITTTDTSDLIFYQDDADNSVGTFFIANVSLQLVNGNTGTLS